MAEKKAPAKKTTKKRKKLVNNDSKAMLQASVAEQKASTSKRGAEVVASIRKLDLGKDVVRFIQTVAKSGGFTDERAVIVAMIRMSMDSARASGPRYFGPHLKRFSK